MSASPDIICFWIAFWFYLLGFIAFAIYVPVRSKTVATLGGIVMLLGFLPHTVGFFWRWHLADHVPLSNMYEYMSLMSWMAVLSLGILVFRYKKPLIGVFIAPLVFMLMVTASLLPKTISQQLVPALQSYWLTIHVTLAALGSGAFAVASAVAFIYLLKSGGVKERATQKTISKVYARAALTMLGFPWIFYVLGMIVGLFPVASDLRISLSQVPIQGTGGFFIAFGIYLPLGLLFWSMWHTRFMKNASGESPGPKLVSVTFASYLIGSLIVGLLISGDKITVTTNSVFKIFEVLGLAYFAAIPVFLILWSILTKTTLLDRIPMNLDILDDINYKAVGLGYPLYTVGALFAGAIWAERAWGQFWGWDPKEVGSLIIWLFYSGFLHARYQQKWKGNRAAVLSLCGFGMIILSFFGNYFFGGQHAYT